jgi:pimeloyl-ACP methyl ester carboxylesterase
MRPDAEPATRGLPHPWLLAPLEPSRASVELGALVLSAPWLLARHTADGHPVLVVPGLSGGNGWTTVMRGLLRAIGHPVHGPRLATTKAPAETVVRRLVTRVEELAHRYDAPVSLVGWSVGGALARRVAAARPGEVRQVVTLGTPLNGRSWHTPASEGPSARLLVPVTAVLSRSDGVFDWRRCVQRTGPLAENVRVPSSHLGMASHPLALHVVADRLSQAQGEWRPFSLLPGAAG